MKKEIIKSGLILGMFVLLVSFASSVAVSSMYWEGKPILASPGETVDFFVVLQNIAGEGGDVEFKGLFIEGGDIAEFTSALDTYLVPFGEKMNVNMSVTVPEDVVVDDIIDIVVAFKIITMSEDGQFRFGSSIERKIPVRVVVASEPETTESTANNYIYYIIGLIALVLAIIVYIKIKKKKLQIFK